MATLQTKPVSTEDKLLEWFKPDERELSRHYDPEKLRLLSENLGLRFRPETAATPTRVR